MSQKSSLWKYQHLAEELVKTAGEILDKKGRVMIVRYKDRQDIVTNLDLQIERLLVRKINKEFPDHNILAEESQTDKKDSPYTWIIDPLDGTKEFVRGIPLYCTAVALERAGHIIVSSVFDPFTNELYSASKGNGAILNGKSIQVSKTQNVEDSLLFAYLPKDRRTWNILSQLNEHVYRIRGHANHNMSFCWVAKGGYDGHISLYHRVTWWDLAPGLFIVKEAGGKVTDLDRYDILQSTYKDTIICSNSHIHDSLLKSLKTIVENFPHDLQSQRLDSRDNR